MSLQEEKLYKEAKPNNHGFFVLMKSQMVVEGLDNYPRMGRCDNLSYAPVNVAVGTAYEDEATTAIRKSPYAKVGFTLSNVGRYEKLIDASPSFFICYMEMVEKTETGYFPALHLEKGDSPSSMWVAKTIPQLLRNIKEWSDMANAPFDSDHPMAVYSKKFWEITNPPETVIDEINNYPDMHLFRFLKGEENYRDETFPYPSLSDTAKEWFELVIQEFNPDIPTSERISSL